MLLKKLKVSLLRVHLRLVTQKKALVIFRALKGADDKDLAWDAWSNGVRCNKMRRT